MPYTNEDIKNGFQIRAGRGNRAQVYEISNKNGTTCTLIPKTLLKSSNADGYPVKIIVDELNAQRWEIFQPEYQIF